MHKDDKPVYDNHDPKFPALPWRDWIRENLPAPRQGFVAEDLDLIILRFGPLENRPYQEDGRFMLVELKQGEASMGYAQERVFSLIHRLLRLADPDQHFYVGFYVWNWFDDGARINGQELSFDELRQFLLGRFAISSLFD